MTDMTNEHIDNLMQQIEATLRQGRNNNYLDIARECGIVAPNDAVLKFAHQLVEMTVKNCADIIEGEDEEIEHRYMDGIIDERPELNGRYYAQVLRSAKF